MYSAPSSICSTSEGEAGSRHDMTVGGFAMPDRGVAVRRPGTPTFRRALLIIVLAALAAGCTITIEGGGQGHLVLHMLHIPASVTHISYVARSDAGLGHYRG